MRLGSPRHVLVMNPDPRGSGLAFFANFAASHLTALAGHAGMAQFAPEAKAAR
jgi:hypothetical protein